MFWDDSPGNPAIDPDYVPLPPLVPEPDWDLLLEQARERWLI